MVDSYGNIYVVASGYLYSLNPAGNIIGTILLLELLVLYLQLIKREIFILLLLILIVVLIIRN